MKRICIECKEDKEHYAKGWCSKCYMKFDQRRFRALNPEKDKERKRKWFLANKDKVAIQRRQSRILRTYGLTMENLEELKKKQKMLCLICKEFLRKVCIDHNHKTGEVRGLLCDSCNTGIGLFADNPEFLINAAKYILDSRRLNEKKEVEYGT